MLKRNCLMQLYKKPMQTQTSVGHVERKRRPQADLTLWHQCHLIYSTLVAYANFLYKNN